MRNPMHLALLAALLLSGCGESHPRVVMATDLGEITLEIYTAEAPLTAANFLRHVEQGSFDGATFYRTVTMGNQPDNDIKIEVIQGASGTGPMTWRLSPTKPPPRPASCTLTA